MRRLGLLGKDGKHGRDGEVKASGHLYEPYFIVMVVCFETE